MTGLTFGLFEIGRSTKGGVEKPNDFETAMRSNVLMSNMLFRECESYALI